MQEDEGAVIEAEEDEKVVEVDMKVGAEEGAAAEKVEAGAEKEEDEDRISLELRRVKQTCCQVRMTCNPSSVCSLCIQQSFVFSTCTLFFWFTAQVSPNFSFFMFSLDCRDTNNKLIDGRTRRFQLFQNGFWDNFIKKQLSPQQVEDLQRVGKRID